MTVKNKGGRPKLSRETTERTAFCLPRSLLVALQKKAALRGQTLSEMVREILVKSVL